MTWSLRRLALAGASVLALTGSAASACGGVSLGLAGATGVVLDAQRRPVVGALIDSVPAGRGACCVPAIAIFTSRTGRFRTPTLHRGEYVFVASKRGYRSARVRRYIGTKTVTLTLTLRR
jgi:hypothetical protein